MSQPPPFVLPPDGPRARVRTVLAGAGRQRVAVALLTLVALAGAGIVWVRATPRLAGPPSQDAAAPADQTLPRAVRDTSTAGEDGASATGGSGPRAALGPRARTGPGPRARSPSTWPAGSATRGWSACRPAAGSRIPRLFNP